MLCYAMLAGRTAAQLVIYATIITDCPDKNYYIYVMIPRPFERIYTSDRYSNYTSLTGLHPDSDKETVPPEGIHNLNPFRSRHYPLFSVTQ